jgi:ribonucleotide reductase beta subunit family protein with ferritin-like domain
MSNLDKLQKYITKDVPITLKDENGVDEVFYFKPMKMKEQIVALDLIKVLKKIQDKEKTKITEERVDELGKEFIEISFDLFMSIVKRSFEGIDEDTAENFVSTNFNELLSNLDKLMPKTKDATAIEKIKQRREQTNAEKS